MGHPGSMPLQRVFQNGLDARGLRIEPDGTQPDDDALGLRSQSSRRCPSSSALAYHLGRG